MHHRPHLLDSARRGRARRPGSNRAASSWAMDALSKLADGKEAKAKLGAFVEQYRKWIDEQRKKAPKSPKKRKETAEELLQRAEVAARRIEQGIALLADPQCLEAFRIANRAMADRSPPASGRDREEGSDDDPSRRGGRSSSRSS